MLKKMFSAIASTLVLVSSLAGDGLGFITKPVSFSVLAIDENSTDAIALTEGEYAIPLKYSDVGTWNMDSPELWLNPGNDNSPAHLYPRAILNIEKNDDKYIYNVTIAVESWSLYDVFVPGKQSELTNTTLPSNGTVPSVNNDKLLYKTVFTEDISLNSYFNWDERNEEAKKYGDINVDRYDESLDTAYITFQIDDYTQPIRVFRWYNKQVGAATKSNKLRVGGYTSIFLDYNHAENLIDLNRAIENNSEIFNRIMYASKNTKANSTYLFGQNFSGVLDVKSLITNVLTSKSDDVITAKYYLGLDPDGNYPTNITTPKNKNLDSSKWQQLWALTPDSDESIQGDDSFENIDIQEDGDGKFFELKFNDKYELIFGKYIYCDISDGGISSLAFFSPCLSTYGDEVINLEYTESDGTGISIITDTSHLDSDTILNAEKNDISVINDNFNSSRFDTESAYYIYTVSLKNRVGSTVTPMGKVKVVIDLPKDLNINDYAVCFTQTDGTLATVQDNLFDSYYNSDDCTFTYEFYDWGSNAEVTFAFVKTADRKNIMELLPGVYSVDINLMKHGRRSNASMADEALNHSAYVVISENEDKSLNRTLYFETVPMGFSGVNDLYIGDIYCDDPGSTGTVFEENTTYLQFLTDDNGKLENNCGYDAVTEWACIKRAAILLDDKSYEEDDLCYDMGVCSPIMCALDDFPFQNVNKDDLIPQLVFYNIERTNMTEADVKALFPYDISALTRQVELAKLKIASKKSFSTDSIAKVQKAYDEVLAAFGGTYDPLNKAEISADKLEELGTNLENAIKDLDGITVAGYNAQLDKDVTFDFYLSMNKNNLEAAQDGELTANITKADGSTETVEVGADGKIEFNVAPKEIGQTLKVKIGSYEFTYSVQEYLEKLLWYAENPTEGVEVSEKDAAIAKSLLVYGGYAQDYFVKKDAEANAYVDTERSYANVDNTLPESAENASAFEAPQLGENIKYYGAAVAFDYATDIRLYFTVKDEIENHSFAVNDIAVTPVAVDGGYYIAIENIYANQLGNPFKITVDGTDFRYGVYNYIAAALNATEVKSGALNELQALVKALYQYAELTKSEA